MDSLSEFELESKFEFKMKLFILRVVGNLLFESLKPSLFGMVLTPTAV